MAKEGSMLIIRYSKLCGLGRDTELLKSEKPVLLHWCTTVVPGPFFPQQMDFRDSGEIPRVSTNLYK